MTDDAQRAVQKLYDSNPEQEWQRGERHRTEFAVTLRALEAHLPPAPARILDCGGGPGRYAIALSQRGYEVILFDLSTAELDAARTRAQEAGVRLTAIEQGTATDLSRFPDDAFDAVLLMGPLYHLLDEEERRQALHEAYRVARPGAPVFAAFINRFAAHRDAAAKYPEYLITQAEDYNAILETGELHPRADGRIAFTAYFAHPDEVVPLCRSAGLEVLAVLGVEGVVSAVENKLNMLEGEAWQTWVELNYRVAHDASLLGGTEHLLAVCRKPRWHTALRLIASCLDHAGIGYRVVGGTVLALHGIDVPVNDFDLDLAADDTYRFQQTCSEIIDEVIFETAYRETDVARSHWGRFKIQGYQVDVLGEFAWRAEDRWLPSFSTTSVMLDLQGYPICSTTLEEETLANLRRRRLERVAAALPHCDPERLRQLLQQAQDQRMF